MWLAGQRLYWSPLSTTVDGDHRASAIILFHHVATKLFCQCSYIVLFGEERHCESYIRIVLSFLVMFILITWRRRFSYISEYLQIFINTSGFFWIKNKPRENVFYDRTSLHKKHFIFLFLKSRVYMIYKEQE